MTLVLCFLHEVLKVQKGSPTYRNLRKKLKTKLWKAYKANTAGEFLKGLRLALIWSKKHLRRKGTLQKIRKLCRRAAQFKIAYQFPQAHRTSNMVDRLMNHQDRLLYTMQYFHGDKKSARLYLRSMANVINNYNNPLFFPCSLSFNTPFSNPHSFNNYLYLSCFHNLQE